MFWCLGLVHLECRAKAKSSLEIFQMIFRNMHCAAETSNFHLLNLTNGSKQIRKTIHSCQHTINSDRKMHIFDLNYPHGHNLQQTLAYSIRLPKHFHNGRSSSFKHSTMTDQNAIDHPSKSSSISWKFNQTKRSFPNQRRDGLFPFGVDYHSSIGYKLYIQIQ